MFLPDLNSPFQIPPLKRLFFVELFFLFILWSFIHLFVLYGMYVHIHDPNYDLQDAANSYTESILRHFLIHE